MSPRTWIASRFSTISSFSPYLPYLATKVLSKLTFSAMSISFAYAYTYRPLCICPLCICTSVAYLVSGTTCHVLTARRLSAAYPGIQTMTACETIFPSLAKSTPASSFGAPTAGHAALRSSRSKIPRPSTQS
ncbi:hypothetical protein EDB83DRAFT_1640259 [Lactarius deliciosus]|nr:hypothetical protein EDB83DRAFT_1640259 [Lactarius deliciosus]